MELALLSGSVAFPAQLGSAAPFLARMSRASTRIAASVPARLRTPCALWTALTCQSAKSATPLSASARTWKPARDSCATSPRAPSVALSSLFGPHLHAATFRGFPLEACLFLFAFTLHQGTPCGALPT